MKYFFIQEPSSPIFPSAVCTGILKAPISILRLTRCQNPFSLKYNLHLLFQEEFFYSKGGETLEEVAQRSCGCSIIESVQGQVGQGFEQPDLVEDVPAHSRGVGLDDL